MDIIDAPQDVVKQTGPIQGGYQPVAALTGLDPQLDDSAVRAAIVQAEAQGIDPMSLPMEALGQPAPVEAPTSEVAPPVPEAPKQQVPEKFLKPDGTADVEKIQASIRQLDEAIQKKEEKLSKTVEDYMAQYRPRETRFKNLPNPDKFAVQPPTPEIQVPDVSGMSTQQLEEIIRRDFQQDPVMTTTRLIELALEKRFEPIKAKEQDDTIRKNISSIAEKDPRFLDPQNFAAVTAKLQSDPDLWKLKNPHKAAWLEVKEEMRLGELSQVQAQPSRPLSPVLGGGTPPSVPSSSVQPQTVIGSLEKLDLRDRKQEAAGDEAIRALLAGRR